MVISSEQNLMYLKTKSKKEIIILLVLVFAGILQYWNVFGYEILDWDDQVQITNNVQVKNDVSIKNTIEIFSSTVAHMYQPLTTLSFNIEKNVFGLTALTFHSFSIFYHIANIILLFYLLCLLFPKLDKYLLIIPCVVFAVHPINNEAVSWISARSTLMSCTFFLLATITYLNYLKKDRLLFYLLSLLFFILSLCSKVISVSFVFIPFVLDYVFGKYSSVKRKRLWLVLSSKIPFVFIAVLFISIALYTRYDFIENSVNNQNFSNYDFLLVIIEQYKWYISNTFLPIDLQPQYKDLVSVSLLNYIWLIPISFFLYFIWKNRKNNSVLLGATIFILGVLPVLKPKPMGHSFITDRYFYISIIGVLILLTYLISKYQHKVIYYFSALLIVVLSLISFKNQKMWANSISIWNKVINDNGIYHDRSFAYEYRGVAYSKKGLYKKAIKDYKKAITLTKNTNKIKFYEQRIDSISNLPDFKK